MPKVAYVCQPCWENAREQSCYADRGDVRVLPTGEWICAECYSNGEWTLPVTDDFAPMWSELPMPVEYVPAE